MAGIVDPEAVRSCDEVGVGNEVSITIGGKIDKDFGKSLEIRGIVKLVSSYDSLTRRKPAVVGNPVPMPGSCICAVRPTPSTGAEKFIWPRGSSSRPDPYLVGKGAERPPSFFSVKIPPDRISPGYAGNIH